jgi:hypothetical protein
LKPETVDALHVPLAGEEYALGWFAMSADASGMGKSIIWHEGSNAAWYAVMLIVPDVERAWVLVSNGYRDALQDQQSGALIALGGLDNGWLTTAG